MPKRYVCSRTGAPTTEKAVKTNNHPCGMVVCNLLGISTSFGITLSFFYPAYHNIEVLRLIFFLCSIVCLSDYLCCLCSQVIFYFL